MAHKIVNGVQIELTAAEVTAMEEQATAWAAGAFDRAIAGVRSKRDALIKATDYLALSDNTLSSEMTTYRQALRDITNGVSTTADVDNITWPTKP
tara:strand:+ start:736 stop:1020 length:285 start_codon:yes stop_codon:yes gene_type:complete